MNSACLMLAFPYGLVIAIPLYGVAVAMYDNRPKKDK
jgi:hypothetical protein